MMDAGHAMQNLLLLASFLGLNAVPIGGFREQPWNRMLSLEESGETTICLVAVGTRAATA